MPQNVHTLRDLEYNGPNREALPDPWKAYPQKTSYTPDSYLDAEFGIKRGFQYTYTGLDGKIRVANIDGNNRNYFKLFCLGCCPCFVPPFCSAERRQEYINVLKMFCFWISLAQLILLIVALGMGGFAPADENSTLGPPSATLIDLGAKFTPKMRYDYEVWRFVTPIFLHAGIFHLFFNLWTQLRFGITLEAKGGMIKFIILYFISGIAGVLLSSLARPASVSVGASGALMGLMGAHLAETLLTWHKTDARARQITLYSSIFSIVIIMLFSFSPFIDFFAHLGGLIAGFAVGAFYFSKECENRRTVTMISIGSATFFNLLFCHWICSFLYCCRAMIMYCK